MDIARDGIHVGVITFSAETKIQVDFSNNKTKDEIISVIRNLPKLNSTTCTYLALEQAGNELFREKRGRRYQMIGLAYICSV